MLWPALDVAGVPADLLLALLDDFSPTAVDDDGATVTTYFPTRDLRSQARDAVAAAFPAATVTARDVDDEDWARRSQENLTPITVGRIVVTPPWASPVPSPQSQAPSPQSQAPSPQSPITIVITPSMGFGTGHHATTRLCLAALQVLDIAGTRVLDIGTGSGILAIAARMLGAADAIGIDFDADAIQAASENLAANPSVERVRFLVGDLRDLRLPQAEIVLANLTGALLVQSAALLIGALRPNGHLIVSGLLEGEREEVLRAFLPGVALVAEKHEDGWTGLMFQVRE